MNLKELGDDPEEALRVMLDGFRQSLHTAMLGEVVKYDPKTMTMDIQPSTKGVIRKPDGTSETVKLPLLTGVPVSFPGGGGTTLTFPVKPGDPVMMTFAQRSSDAWNQSGGTQDQIDARSLDLADAVAHVGIRHQASLPQNVSGSATQLRTDDGKTSFTLDGAGGLSLDTDQAVSVKGAKGISMDGGSGDLHVTGDLFVNGISFLNHIHDNVQPGGGNSGKPVGA